VKSGAASPGFNAAHAVVEKRPRQRERNRVDGFTGRILLFRAGLAAKTKLCKQNIMLLPIKSNQRWSGFLLCKNADA
jgi:hypothetical protein